MKTKTLKIWRAIPCKLVLFLTAASLALGEFYPFSDYPMYSQFKGTEYYLYLTDGSDRALACENFHTSAPKLKKRFKGKLKKLAAREKSDEEDVSADGLAEIGRETLTSYLGTAEHGGPMASVRELKLILVDVGYQNEAIVKTERVIATLPFPSK
jgi:hypothetical protein